MRTLKEICEYFDNLLKISEFKDYSNNGLQVEASEEIRRVAFAVDASAVTFEKAIDAKADLLFVHHGISWREGMKYFTGLNAKRLSTLFRNRLSLYAAHLPLDANPEVGNNAVLSGYFDLIDKEPAFFYHGQNIGFVGNLRETLSVDDIAGILAEHLRISRSEVRIFSAGDGKCRRLGFVSGGGSGSIEDCVALGCDTFVTGEIVHQHQILASDLKISVVTAGHYATETTGPSAVMHAFARQFPEIDCVWIDAPTGL